MIIPRRGFQTMTLDNLKKIRDSEDQIRAYKESVDEEISKLREKLPSELDRITREVEERTQKKLSELQRNTRKTIENKKKGFVEQADCDCDDLKKKASSKKNQAITAVVNYILQLSEKPKGK
jgi:vacuolar-type H+-ATPase subunit H